MTTAFDRAGAGAHRALERAYGTQWRFVARVAADVNARATADGSRPDITAVAVFSREPSREEPDIPGRVGESLRVRVAVQDTLDVTAALAWRPRTGDEAVRIVDGARFRIAHVTVPIEGRLKLVLTRLA